MSLPCVKVLCTIFIICLFSLYAQAETLRIARINLDNTLTTNTGKQIELADIVLVPSKQLKAYMQDKDLIITEYYQDRYKNLVVRTTLQEELLRKGLAYMYVMHPMNPELQKQWEQAEQEARDRRRGLWSLAQFKIITVDAIVERSLPYKQKFAFVQGVIRNAKYSKGRYYFYFGDDPSTDFTTMITQANAAELTLDTTQQWIGKTVLMRGWIEYFKGPYMQLYHLSQIAG